MLHSMVYHGKTGGWRKKKLPSQERYFNERTENLKALAFNSIVRLLGQHFINMRGINYNTDLSKPPYSLSQEEMENMAEALEADWDLDVLFADDNGEELWDYPTTIQHWINAIMSQWRESGKWPQLPRTPRPEIKE